MALDIPTKQEGDSLQATEFNEIVTAVDANETSIGNTNTQVSTNTSNIATNTSDIADNTSEITSNGLAIQTNAGKIDVTETDIADNLSLIQALTAELNALKGQTGGADYDDTQYTDASPLTITAGIANKINLPNNAGSVYDTQKPTYIPTFYDGVTGKILGRNGDFFALTIEVTARPTSNATNVRLRIAIDIGGTVGEIYPDERPLTRANGVSQTLVFSLPVIYSRDTFEANGGQVKLWSENSDVEIYNIRYVFANHHKAR